MVAPFLAIMGALFLLSYHLASPDGSLQGFLTHPYGRLFLVISVKSSLTLMLLRLLMLSTPIPDLLWAMRRFGFPRIVTTLSLLVASYLHLLTEETDRIIRAKKSRSSRRDRHPLRSLAHVAATIFLRSMSRAERLYKAMLARGFTGDYPDIRSAGFGFYDAMIGVSAMAVIFTGALWIH
jgi:cobalt/nickel transport system permease protein